MGIANYRIFGKLFRGKAGNLNGNSPIKHVYKVTGQFTLVIAGNNVESNGNSSLKLDRNGPRYILSPPPPLSSSLPNSLFPSREKRRITRSRIVYYKFLFRNPITYSERHCNVVSPFPLRFYCYRKRDRGWNTGQRSLARSLTKKPSCVRFITDEIKTTYFRVIFFRVFVFSRNEPRSYSIDPRERERERQRLIFNI